jgi:SAM-dependent methyltransferase
MTISVMTSRRGVQTNKPKHAVLRIGQGIGLLALLVLVLLHNAFQELMVVDNSKEKEQQGSFEPPESWISQEEMQDKLRALREEIEQAYKESQVSADHPLSAATIPKLGFVDFVIKAKRLTRSRKPESDDDQYTCPCCGWTGPMFSPYGSGRIKGLSGRANAQCPQCKALERHRRGCAFLGTHPEVLTVKHEEAQDSQKNGALRVIYFGPHIPMARVLDNSPSKIDQIWVDFNEAMYNRKKSVKTLHVDIQQLQFPDNFAHGMMLFHVMEHIPDLDQAFSEIKRVLRPNGWVMIEVPFGRNMTKTKDCRGLALDEDRIRCAGQKDHQWVFDQTDFEQAVLAKYLDCKVVSSMISERVGPATYATFQLLTDGVDVPQYFCRSAKKKQSSNP